MNETAPPQKQDINRVLSVLERIDAKLDRLTRLYEWEHRDDPAPAPESTKRPLPSPPETPK